MKKSACNPAPNFFFIAPLNAPGFRLNHMRAGAMIEIGPKHRLPIRLMSCPKNGMASASNHPMNPTKKVQESQTAQCVFVSEVRWRESRRIRTNRDLAAI
jgi:hypothetical protein